MSNATFFSLLGSNVPPGIAEKYWKWAFEAYIPIVMKAPNLLGVDNYRIVNKSPAYPEVITIYH